MLGGGLTNESGKTAEAAEPLMPGCGSTAQGKLGSWGGSMGSLQILHVSVSFRAAIARSHGTVVRKGSSERKSAIAQFDPDRLPHIGSLKRQSL